VVAGEAGAGKTSLLRALLGLAPSAGRARVLGAPPGAPAALRRVGYGPQGREFAGAGRARELVRLLARVRGLAAPDAAAEDALERAGLDAGARRAAVAAGPEQARRVSLACGVLGDPDLLLLDDPWELPETLAEVARARARGAAVVVTARDPAPFAAALGRTLTLVDGVPAPAPSPA
jgi:ABC-type multidrug transport system ATPase subunit